MQPLNSHLGVDTQLMPTNTSRDCFESVAHLNEKHGVHKGKFARGPSIAQFENPFMHAAPPIVSRKWKGAAIGLSFALAGLVIWDGADRRPVDATQPLPQSPPSAISRSAPETLRIGSFNIHSGKGTDGTRNLGRTGELLADVDFAGLYEVRATSDAGEPNQAAIIAHQRETAWLFAPSERQWWSDHFGNGLVYRIPVHSVIRLPLINTRGKAYRNAILSTVKLQSTDVRIISVHIDREEDRERQLRAVFDLFLGLQEPCVLMGDLNTRETDPLLVDLRNHPGVRSPLDDVMSDGSTVQSIDWIFTRGLKTISAALIENTASDHPYLRAELAPQDES